jgi:uncharacterized membrane protein
MLIYSRVNCAFSPIYALSRTHLRDFKTAFMRFFTFLTINLGLDTLGFSLVAALLKKRDQRSSWAFVSLLPK